MAFSFLPFFISIPFVLTEYNNKLMPNCVLSLKVTYIWNYVNERYWNYVKGIGTM